MAGSACLTDLISLDLPYCLGCSAEAGSAVVGEKEAELADQR